MQLKVLVKFIFLIQLLYSCETPLEQEGYIVYPKGVEALGDYFTAGESDFGLIKTNVRYKLILNESYSNRVAGNSLSENRQATVYDDDEGYSMIFFAGDTVILNWERYKGIPLPPTSISDLPTTHYQTARGFYFNVGDYLMLKLQTQETAFDLRYWEPDLWYSVVESSIGDFALEWYTLQREGGVVADGNWNKPVRFFRRKDYTGNENWITRRVSHFKSLR